MAMILVYSSEVQIEQMKLGPRNSDTKNVQTQRQQIYQEKLHSLRLNFQHF